MKQRLKMLFLILLGNTLLAFSICAFAVPQDFMLGGVTGIGLIVQELVPVRLSVVAGAANVALFLLGWVFLGKKFAMTSLLSTLLYPLIMAASSGLSSFLYSPGTISICAEAKA